MIRNSLAIAFLLLCSVATAQEPRHTTAQERCATAQERWRTTAQMVGLGTTSVLDTYLSPEEYSGTSVAYTAQSIRETSSSAWLHKLTHQGSFASLNNRSGNGGELTAAYRFAYDRQRQWHLNALSLYAGIGAELSTGFLYNTRNSNNPAQAQLTLNIAPSAVAAYGFTAWHHVLTARLEVAVPLVGVMFSPSYGQSYYEIFNLGNYDHNIVPTTLFSAPSLRYRLCLDVPIGSTALRIGYEGDMRQAQPNNLKYHAYTHQLLIGVVRRINYSR